MHKKFTLLLSITLLFSNACFSQATITIGGKIINDATGEPISYATISLSTKGINTMSNESGAFVFKIPVESKNDSIHISHIGFQAVVFATTFLLKGNNVIKLQEKVN